MKVVLMLAGFFLQLFCLKELSNTYLHGDIFYIARLRWRGYERRRPEWWTKLAEVRKKIKKQIKTFEKLRRKKKKPALHFKLEATFSSKPDHLASKSYHGSTTFEILLTAFALSSFLFLLLLSVSLWQKYSALPKQGRLWIGITTMAVAYLGGKVVDNMYDEALIKEEAERRLQQARPAATEGTSDSANTNQ